MEKTTTKENIGVFKLVTGEEIVTEFESLTADSVTFKKPRMIVLSQDQRTGKVGMQLGPWILTEQDGDYRVDRNNIVTMKIAEVDPRLVQTYLKNTTGIDVQTAAGNLVKP